MDTSPVWWLASPLLGRLTAGIMTILRTERGQGRTTPLAISIEHAMQ